MRGLFQEKPPDGELCHTGCHKCLVLLPLFGNGGGLTCGRSAFAEVLSSQVEIYHHMW